MKSDFFLFNKIPDNHKQLFYTLLDNLTCLKLVHPIEYEYVDLNIQIESIIYNTTPVILFKKKTHFGPPEIMYL